MASNDLNVLPMLASMFEFHLIVAHGIIDMLLDSIC